MLMRGECWFLFGLLVEGDVRGRVVVEMVARGRFDQVKLGATNLCARPTSPKILLKYTNLKPLQLL